MFIGNIMVKINYYVGFFFFNFPTRYDFPTRAFILNGVCVKYIIIKVMDLIF